MVMIYKRLFKPQDVKVVHSEQPTACSSTSEEVHIHDAVVMRTRRRCDAEAAAETIKAGRPWSWEGGRIRPEVRDGYVYRHDLIGAGGWPHLGEPPS